MALTGFKKVSYRLGGQIQHRYEPVYGSGSGGSGGGGGATVNPAAMSALDRAMAHYREGGGYGAGVEAGLERGETKAVASGMQNLVSAGLASTTQAGGLSKKYQEEVAMPARAKVEETRAQAISGLEVMKAQIISGATESARARALQKYLGELSAGTQLSIAGRSRGGSTGRVSAPSRTTAQAPAAPAQHTGSYPSPYEATKSTGPIAGAPGWGAEYGPGIDQPGSTYQAMYPLPIRG